MIMMCDGLEVTVKTVSQIKCLNTVDTIRFIKEQNGSFMLDGYKVYIEKPFIENIDKGSDRKGYGEYASKCFKYIWDGEKMIHNKTVKEIAQITDMAYTAIISGYKRSTGYFIVGKHVIANTDLRGKERHIRQGGTDGERFYFGSIPKLIKNLGISRSKSYVWDKLDRHREYAEGKNIIWKNRESI